MSLVPLKLARACALFFSFAFGVVGLAVAINAIVRYAETIVCDLGYPTIPTSEPTTCLRPSWRTCPPVSPFRSTIAVCATACGTFSRHSRDFLFAFRYQRCRNRFSCRMWPEHARIPHIPPRHPLLWHPWHHCCPTLYAHASPASWRTCIPIALDIRLRHSL